MPTSLVRRQCEGCGSSPSRWFVDQHDTVFCESCRNSPRCFACSAPAGRLSSPAVRLADGRVRCGHCSHGAVDTQEDVRRVVPEVRNFYSGLDVSSPNRAQVVLVPTHAMLLSGGSAHLGQTLMVQRRGRLSVTRIELVSGLPLLDFQRVLGHEIGHGFLAGCRPRRRSDAEVEGICELVSSWWLQNRGNPAARELEQAMLANTDPTYGAGYRAVSQATAGLSIAEIVTRLRHGDRL